MKKKLTIGILAHVDAGKTTLSEALLYISGKIRTLGRVDHKNTYLDTAAVERERGITVFSKQARFSTKTTDYILLDTPGHVDFSAETERTLSLLDYAILLISASDGVQSHTKTLWSLLKHYNIPTFIFVNKTDISIKLREELENELSSSLSPLCVPFEPNMERNALEERLALVNEEILEAVTSGERITDEEIATLISDRRLFPCIFGSALRIDGVDFLLDCIDRYTLSPIYDEKEFGAKIYKISRIGNTRLTYMKITCGTLKARNEIAYIGSDGKARSEKINQIRLYSGDKYEQTDMAEMGEICAVTGLSDTYAGQGLGVESDSARPLLEPVISYRIILPVGCDPSLYYPKLKELEEEEPSLHLCWNDELSQIEARLMGDIQIDVLKRLIYDRLSISCELDVGKILYKETLRSKAIGIGHFEPLRHYAEVQLLLEPQPQGTGLIFDTKVNESFLALNWQRLILSHLYEKAHRGILTGAMLTDTKITLIAGKAHLKHTEGGDFREATFRAVRHGLMRGGCTLLEPYYKFTLEIPTGLVGRAINDLQARNAEFEISDASENFTVISGKAPVSTLHGYIQDVTSYSHGEGKISCVPCGYYPCHNVEEIIAESNYDPEADTQNPPHSVFCSHGAATIVNWRDVESCKHIETPISVAESASSDDIIPRASSLSKKYKLSDEELEAIMLREFGPIRRKKYSEPKIVGSSEGKKITSHHRIIPEESMTIIDGYNLIYSWDVLNEISKFNLEKARETLIDILKNYVAFTKEKTVLVFDAYRVEGGTGSDTESDLLRTVFTKQNQTADAFIERMMHELGPNYKIRVVTGDRLVQFSAVHSGISRMTVSEFVSELILTGNEINEFARKFSEL